MRTLPHVFYSLLTVVQFCTGYDEWYPCRGCGTRHAVKEDHSTCVNTEDGFPMTWHIDLQEVRSIARISTFHNTSGIRRQVHNYEVYLSNTTRWQNGFLCIEDAGPSSAITAFKETCQVFARYVVFHNAAASDGANSAIIKFPPVCGIIVEGCEKTGTYGFNCDQRCPENCRDNRCQIESGDCFSCRDGWAGKKCQKQAVRPLEDTDTTPLAVIIGVSVPVSALALTAIVISIVCNRRSFRGYRSEKPQCSDCEIEDGTSTRMGNDSRQYAALNFDWNQI